MVGMRHKQRERNLTKNSTPVSEQETRGAQPPRPNSKTEEAAKSASRLLGTEVEQDTPPREATETHKLPLGHIRLDPENVRTRYIALAKPTENVLSPDHPDYASNQALIDGLIEFSKKLKTNPVLQHPAVYMEKGHYYTAYGARRFLSLLIAYGPNVGATFKVYKSKPQKLSSMRFAENSQREDLPLSGKVMEFRNAYNETVELLNEEGQKPTLDAIANELQKSSSLVSVYRYAIDTTALYDMVIDGRVTTFNELRAARKAKANTVEEILSVIKQGGEPEKSMKPLKKRASGGRPLRNVSWPKVRDVSVMKKVINGELSRFEWCDDDFESLETLSVKLRECMEVLKGEQDGE